MPVKRPRQFKTFRSAPAFHLTLLALLLGFSTSHAQTELEPWGNLSGIRIDGQLMNFETSLSVVQKDWSRVISTGKERQRPRYTREGDTQVVSTRLDSLDITEAVTDGKKGSAMVRIKFQAKADMPAEGVYLCVILPGEFVARGKVRLDRLKPFPLSVDPGTLQKDLQKPVRSLYFSSPSRGLRVMFQKPRRIILKKGTDQKNIRVFIPVQEGDLKKNQQFSGDFSIKASGTIDRKPVTLRLDTAETGRPFEGLGGNFRLQNPREDPKVIDYCLNNLRVAWGRVEMPWSMWQPDMGQDPILAAKAGRLNPHVRQSMEMAQRLYKKGIPLILSAWFPPAWAVQGKLNFKPGADGVWGNPLDPDRTPEIYKSIADYISYLQDAYGVKIADFSFNESDLGINVRQTGEQQDALIKGLGAYFVSRGLTTKLLLGDNSDATTYAFIEPALNDPAARPYIGAVCFHSWRGWDTETLQKWADAARQIGLPLIVGEGSIDAQAWGYPEIFEEPSYALKEINLYIRLLAICQPEAILQWQFTSDYSLLAGGGIYGNNSPLHPTQRFWNLKQLASTPTGLNALPLLGSAPSLTVAALGDPARGMYAVHLVNNGATRQVRLTGLPETIKTFRVWVTGPGRSMQQESAIRVKNGQAVFKLQATCFTSLISGEK